jgi:hypothetical protein
MLAAYNSNIKLQTLRLLKERLSVMVNHSINEYNKTNKTKPNKNKTTKNQ